MGLDTVELLMSFEEEFDIQISDTTAEQVVSVRDVVEFVAAEYERLGRPVDRQDIFERVRKRTVDVSNVDPSQVNLDTTFVEDLRMD
jgi:acyl carrier protein